MNKSSILFFEVDLQDFDVIFCVKMLQSQEFTSFLTEIAIILLYLWISSINSTDSKATSVTKRDLIDKIHLNI